MSESKKSIPLKRMKKLPDDVIITSECVRDLKTLQTEDLGKIFEMAICLLYKIPFNGKYKYSMEEAQLLCSRINSLLEVFPHQIKHTAKNGNQYDFCGIEDESIKLSAKTTKNNEKVCPQVIGQPSKKKICEFFNIDVSMDLEEIKLHIEANVRNMLYIYFDLTFDCPIIYYNKMKNKLQLIKAIKNIEWNVLNVDFSHLKKQKQWVESSTISINSVTIGEFQIHNHRDCIKFRWAFENLLRVFAESFNIINL